MEIETLQAEPRAESGTRVARKLRDAGKIPAVIYGHGEPPQSVSLTLHNVKIALAHGARTLKVDVGGSKQQFLIKEVQYDHLGAEPIHMDLTRVSMDERVKVRVGIELRGTPKGCNEGGVLEQHMADIEVECRVVEIPDTFHPFVTELGIGDSLYVKDLDLPAGIVPAVDGEERVATVRAAEKEAESVDEEAGEAQEGEAEPERIGRVRKDDEEKADDSKKS